MYVYKFPYDIQTCSMIIGSWTLSNQQIAMSLSESLNSNSFVGNSIWDLKGTNVLVQNTTRINAQYLTTDIYFQMTVQRKPMYYIINNVYPCLILNVVTLFTFNFQFAQQSSLSNFLVIMFLKFKNFLKIIFTFKSFINISKHGSYISESSWRFTYHF